MSTVQPAARLVVIVDDNESVASSLALAFASIANVESVVTTHPSGALRIFAERTPVPGIAAIVTDFNLPYVDGLQLIAEVRALDGYAWLPAILITGEENLLGASGCILNTPNAIFRKPFSIREVCRVLEQLLA